MRNYVLTENRPYTACPIWKKDLRKPTIDQIISQAEQEAKPTETARQVYNRAWQKFRKHLLTN